MTRAILALSLVFFVSQSALGVLKRPKTDDDAFKMLADNFANAWNKHDVRAMAAYHAEDATTVNPTGRWARGRAEIENLFKEEHATLMKESRMTPVEMKYQTLRKDVVVFDWELDITNITVLEGHEPPPTRYHVAGVLQKKNNQWWIAASRPYVFLRKPSQETAQK